jgi:hypothetical protein
MRRVLILGAAATLAAAAPASAAFTGAAANAGSGATAAATFAPKPATPPTITGTPVEGATLTGHVGNWSREPAGFELQWLRCAASCEAIEGATAATYVPRAGDAGTRLRFRVTARNAGGSRDAESEPTAPIQTLPAPRATVPPAVTGTPRSGAALTATTGTWEHADAIAIAWERCRADACTAIEEATTAQYVATSADVGATLRARVTATNRTGSATALSTPTSLVAGRYDETIRADRPTWWWRFDDPAGATVAREEIAGAHGSYVGGTTQPGAVGRSAYVGGSSHVAFGDVADLDGNRPFTIELLLMPHGYGQWRPILSKLIGTSSGREGWSMYLTPTGDLLCERRHAKSADVAVAPALQTYAWSHVACVYDGSSLRVHVNGVQRAGATAGLPIGNTSIGLTAGLDDLGQRFTGLLDELAIWSGAALTAEQLRRHHDSRGT